MFQVNSHCPPLLGINQQQTLSHPRLGKAARSRQVTANKPMMRRKLSLRRARISAAFKIRMVSLAITPMTGHTITSGWKLLQRHGQSRRKPPPRTKYHTSPHGRLDHNSFAKPVTKTPYNIAHASRGKAWRVARACFTRPARVRPNERSLCKNACTCRCSALWMICPASSAATNNPSYILK